MTMPYTSYNQACAGTVNQNSWHYCTDVVTAPIFMPNSSKTWDLLPRKRNGERHGRSPSPKRSQEVKRRVCRFLPMPRRNQAKRGRRGLYWKICTRTYPPLHGLHLWFCFQCTWELEPLTGSIQSTLPPCLSSIATILCPLEENGCCIC